MLSISRPGPKAKRALFFIASDNVVLALLASALDLKQNSRMAMNMAKTKKAAKKKNTPTTLANESTPRFALRNLSSAEGHSEAHHFF